MVVGTAAGLSNATTIVVAVALAFVFGYSFTIVPLLRSGMTLSRAIPVALAADTLSIAVMEAVDNGLMLLIPGAMEAGVADPFFWITLAASLLVAGVAVFPVNRWMIGRGLGHAAAHGHHAAPEAPHHDPHGHGHGAG